MELRGADLYLDFSLPSLEAGGEDDVSWTAARLRDAAVDHASDRFGGAVYPLPTER